jgi:predicted enzyme related to lactoylglutathione lyase
MAPSYGNGKICYIVIPSTDPERSAAFYGNVFGWHIRKRNDGSIAFDDGVGQVSGTWAKGKPAARDPKLLIYIMVDSASATLEQIIANGGNIIKPLGEEAPELTAWFSDPDGNVMGVYQQPNG